MDAFAIVIIALLSATAGYVAGYQHAQRTIDRWRLMLGSIYGAVNKRRTALDRFDGETDSAYLRRVGRFREGGPS